MTTTIKRPDFVNSLLKALLVVSILGFVLSAAWMFITGDARGVYAYGVTAIYCLLNSVGATLIRRWNKVGIRVCLVACLVECSCFFMRGLPLPYSSTSSVTVKYLPYLIIRQDIERGS